MSLPASPTSTIQKYFESLQVSFTVSSAPILGVPFRVDGVPQATLYNGETTATTITLDAYPTILVGGQTYSFKGWDDGLTNPVRTGDLTLKRNFTMYYELVTVGGVAPADDYRPVIITIVAVLGFATICLIAYLASKKG